MNNPPLSGGFLRVVQATPEEVTALVPVVAAGRRFVGEKLVGVYFVLARDLAQSAGAAPRYLFCEVGTQWKVIFDGGAAFYLGATLGARYLGYLLHHPNVPISAFDLELAVTKEKGEVRTKDSIQPESDPQAKREYREALRKLQAEREHAEAADDATEVERLDSEMEALESALRAGGGAADTGRRARTNVWHAVRAVRAQLRKGGRAERAFGEHLRTQVSTGYECLYIQPEGRIWE
jgi:hypothetical protein